MCGCCVLLDGYMFLCVFFYYSVPPSSLFPRSFVRKVLKGDPMASARLAWRYIAMRVVYTLVYLCGEGTQAAGIVRAIVWGLGFSSTVSLFRLALKA